MWTAEQGLWGILLPAEKKACFGGGKVGDPLRRSERENVRPLWGAPSSPGKSGIHGCADFSLPLAGG